MTLFLTNVAEGPMQRTSGVDASPDACWEQVLHRDPEAVGRFVYAVITTGIFCHPTCPSRKPLRGNVRFFRDASEARSQGYRPCLRCAPEAAEGVPPWLGAALARLEQDGELPSLEELAALAGLSRWHFQRKFRAALGLTPRQYGAARRGQRLREELPRHNNVTEAIFAAGFASLNRPYAEGRRALGMTPGQFRRGGRDCAIAHAVLPTRFGLVLLAATGQGVCALELGTDATALVAALHQRFPAAIHRDDPAALSPALATLARYLEDPRVGLALPLDLQGSVFQHQVWHLLTQIPVGRTRSYGELARELGRAGAARAVGRACATNPAPLAVPCHRAVGAAGGLTGFRWGMEVKGALLAAEASPGQREESVAGAAPALQGPDPDACGH